MSTLDPNINKIFFDKFKCEKKIGKGSFGTVYAGTNLLTKQQIAIKLEKKCSFLNTLETEAYRLMYLQGKGIPHIMCYGSNHEHNILIQELLGRSLDDLFNSLKRKFSLKTVCVLGIEMLKRIQHVHSKHHIHRDIKPDNFMISKNINDNTIYIIDFGLSKKYYSTSKQKHIQFCKGKKLIGTARYCARNAHKGYEQSRRDDIESIGYVLIYFLRGSLPWQGIKVKQYEDQFEKIAMRKYNITINELCRGCPDEFVLYFNYVDILQFEDEPNYKYLIELFQQMIRRYCNDVHYDFDWKQDMGKYNNMIGMDVHNKSRGVSLVANKNGLSANNDSRNDPEKNEDDDDDTNDNDSEEMFNVNQHHNDVDSFHRGVEHNEQMENVLTTHKENEEKKEYIENKQQQLCIGKRNKNFIRNSCLINKKIGDNKGEGYNKGKCCCVVHDRDKIEHNEEYKYCNHEHKYMNNEIVKNDVLCQKLLFNYLDDMYIKNAANLNTDRKVPQYELDKPPISHNDFSNIQLQINQNHSRNRNNNNNNIINGTTDHLKDSTKCTCITF